MGGPWYLVRSVAELPHNVLHEFQDFLKVFSIQALRAIEQKHQVDFALHTLCRDDTQTGLTDKNLACCAGSCESQLLKGIFTHWVSQFLTLIGGTIL